VREFPLNDAATPDHFDLVVDLTGLTDEDRAYFKSFENPPFEPLSSASGQTYGSPSAVISNTTKEKSGMRCTWNTPS
jgi:hypothetical protein